MGKYDFAFSQREASVLLANELAEANRLKRLDINLKITLNRKELSDELQYYRGELEDKA